MKLYTRKCKRCGESFKTEKLIDYELDDYGDEIKSSRYVHYNTYCSRCDKELEEIRKDPIKNAEWNYKQGLLTKEEYERILKGEIKI